MQENPEQFDPRKYLKLACKAMQDICEDRFKAFGTAGQADKIRVLSMEEMTKKYMDGSLDLEYKLNKP